MAKLLLRILTPSGSRFDGPVDMVIMRCISDTWVSAMDGKELDHSDVGDIGILPGHVSCFAVLGINPFRIKVGDKEYAISVYGGIVEIEKDIVTVLTGKFETPWDIDRAGDTDDDKEKREETLKDLEEDLIQAKKNRRYAEEELARIREGGTPQALRVQELECKSRKRDERVAQMRHNVLLMNMQGAGGAQSFSRRMYGRVNVWGDIEGEASADQRQWEDIRVQDINEVGGLRFIVNKDYSVGAQLDFRLQIPDDAGDITLRGEILRDDGKAAQYNIYSVKCMDELPDSVRSRIKKLNA